MTENLPSGHTMEVLEGEVAEKLKKNYFMYRDGIMNVNPGGWILPTNFTMYSKKIFNFDIKPSDIFVLTYPKSGTTWVQEIVWNLKFNPNLDNKDADLTLDLRFPNFEADMFIATTNAPAIDPNGAPMTAFNKLFPGKNHFEEGLLVSLAAFAPEPRMMKNHLPLCFLPPKTYEVAKCIYVARDPRDVISSLYHFVRLQVLWGFTGTLDDFVDDIINDRGPFNPYWTHLKLAWDKRHLPNFCMVFYEDLKNDIVSEVKRINKFLGTNRDDKQIQNIIHHTSFSQMKERSKLNPPTSNDNTYFNKDVEKEEGGFFRKGQVGDWKNRFSPEQAEKLNAWMAKNLAQFGDDFKYKV